MLRQDDIHVMEEFGNARAPHQYRVTHVPTGVYVIGNTGSEENKPKLLMELTAALEKSLPETERTPQPENTIGMQSQLDALQEQMAAMMALLSGGKPVKPPKVAKTTAPLPKKKGRPKGSKMVNGKVVKPEEAIVPEGYSVLDPTKVAPMPSSLPPMPTRTHKPTQVVATVSDKAAAKGIAA